MADIGVRSGKVRKGLYTCGKYVIELMPSGWWFVWTDFSNADKKMLKQFDTLGNAYHWCRKPDMLK